MTFTVFKASDYDFQTTVTFNTLEELRDYQIDAGVSLIINFKENEIWIYDDYMEQSSLKKIFKKVLTKQTRGAIIKTQKGSERK